jgi:hypothetical protein
MKIVAATVRARRLLQIIPYPILSANDGEKRKAGLCLGLPKAWRKMYEYRQGERLEARIVHQPGT